MNSLSTLATQPTVRVFYGWRVQISFTSSEELHRCHPIGVMSSVSIASRSRYGSIGFQIFVRSRFSRPALTRRSATPGCMPTNAMMSCTEWIRGLTLSVLRYPPAKSSSTGKASEGRMPHLRKRAETVREEIWPRFQNLWNVLDFDIYAAVQ